MADNDPKTNEGLGKEYVPKAFIILFGVLLLAGAGALLYCLYTACPVCEPPESAAGVAPRATAGTPQPSPSPSPGVAASPTPVPELKLIAFAPDSGSVMGGNLVRLDGIGLNNVKEVRFGGLPATLVGIFSPQALEKLKNVSEIIFNKPEVNEHGEDRLFPKESEKPPLEVEKAMPSEGQENQPVTILGKGFVKGKVRVRFGDKAAKVAKVEDEEITVTTPDHPPGNVKVVVIQDGKSYEAPGGFTYKNAEPAPENKPEDKDE